jgi:uncharacterized protein (DUF362 family)
MLARITNKPPAEVAVSRRSLLAGVAGSALLQSCSRQPGPLPDTHVAVIPAAEYSQAIYEDIRRIVSEFRLDVRGKRVVLKPNLVEYDPAAPINTNPVFVHAVLEAFRSLGPAELRIAEGPGHRRGTLDLADAAGYFSAIPGFEDLFTDLNLDEVTAVKLSQPHSKLTMLYLPHTILGADLIVSLPKMKTHHWAGATLSMKNFFGLVPGGVYGWPKNVLHWAGIDQSIADLYRLIPKTFAIVDGIHGMEGNGPIQGTLKASGVIAAGPDLAAVDETCCRMMGIDPLQVGYLQLAAQSGLARVIQIGESPDRHRTDFELLPQLQHLRLTSAK